MLCTGPSQHQRSQSSTGTRWVQHRYRQTSNVDLMIRSFLRLAIAPEKRRRNYRLNNLCQFHHNLITVNGLITVNSKYSSSRPSQPKRPPRHGHPLQCPVPHRRTDSKWLTVAFCSAFLISAKVVVLTALFGCVGCSPALPHLPSWGRGRDEGGGGRGGGGVVIRFAVTRGYRCTWLFSVATLQALKMRFTQPGGDTVQLGLSLQTLPPTPTLINQTARLCSSVVIPSHFALLSSSLWQTAGTFKVSLVSGNTQNTFCLL